MERFLRVGPRQALLGYMHNDLMSHHIMGQWWNVALAILVVLHRPSERQTDGKIWSSEMKRFRRVRRRQDGETLEQRGGRAISELLSDS